MKYIKTKTNIFEVVGENDKVYYIRAVKNKNHIYSKSKYKGNEILKESDNLLDLLDKLVLVDDTNFRLIYDLLFVDASLLIGNMRKTDKLYGAIWVENGLKYVAKLNDEENLELL